jgi:ethanolamine-phosphate cytidylyltransferase
MLQQAKELGDHLVVGVHSDATVNEQRGYNYPILNMNERVLSVLGCRYVDDVLLDAPWCITEDMIATMSISVVVRGTVRDCADSATVDPRDPHAVPIRMGIHKELRSKVSLTLGDVVGRLQEVKQEAERRLAEKHRKERAWYCEKHGLAA